MSLSQYFTLGYYLNGMGYVKAGNIDLVKNAPVTDEDIERIDIDFARKAREAIRWLGANGTDVPAIVHADKAGIIGSSVNIQSRLRDAKELNTQIEAYIQKFSKAGNCEVSGRWHLNGALRAMVEFTDKDGGFLIRHHYNNSWEIPYRFELIEVGMIDVRKNDLKKQIMNGLTKDKYGRVTHVHLFNTQDRRESKPIPMSELIYFSPVWISISQYTSVSQLSTMLPTLDKLDQYTDAELQAAVERAKAGKYWKTAMYDDIMKIVRAEKDDSTRREQLGTLMRRISEQGVKPNGLTPIPLGDDVVKTDEASASVFPNLAKNAKQNMSASAGLSAQIVYQDSSDSNYSSIKAMMAFASVEWNIRFDDLLNLCLSQIIEKVVSIGVMKGKITAPGYHQDPDKYLKLEYMRVTDIDIEPLKTANADKIRDEAGHTSPREIARRRGRNYEDVLIERIEDEKLEQELRAQYGMTEPKDAPVN